MSAAAVIGPLVVVPTLIGLIHVAVWFAGRWTRSGGLRLRRPQVPQPDRE